MPVDIRLTYDDYCLLPTDGKRYEIIEGELFVTPAPNFRHQIIVTRLAYYLTDYLNDHPLGIVLVSPFDVVFSQFDVVEPDILYISKARYSVLTEKNAQGSPNLVVEVLSQSTAKTDKTLKLKLYARFEVDEYWIIDPEGPAAEIHRREKGSLELAAALDARGLLASPLFPGFTLPLQKLVE